MVMVVAVMAVRVSSFPIEVLETRVEAVPDSAQPRGHPTPDIWLLEIKLFFKKPDKLPRVRYFPQRQILSHFNSVW